MQERVLGGYKSARVVEVSARRSVLSKSYLAQNTAPDHSNDSVIK